MEIPTLTPAEEVLDPTDWYEEEFDLLAFELWQRASRPEAEVERTSIRRAEAACREKAGVGSLEG